MKITFNEVMLWAWKKYAKTIIPTIEANYERYTETERHIADYF